MWYEAKEVESYPSRGTLTFSLSLESEIVANPFLIFYLSDKLLRPVRKSNFPARLPPCPYPDPLFQFWFLQLPVPHLYLAKKRMALDNGFELEKPRIREFNFGGELEIEW